MTQVVTLKKVSLDDGGNVVTEEKKALVRLNVAKAMKLKELDIFDVFEPLDKGLKESSMLTDLLLNRDKTIRLAGVMFDDINGIDEWLDEDTLEEVNSAFITSLVNFSPPHIRDALLIAITKSKETITKMGVKLTAEIEKMMDQSEQAMMDLIPTGEKLAEEMKETLSASTGS